MSQAFHATEVGVVHGFAAGAGHADFFVFFFAEPSCVKDPFKLQTHPSLHVYVTGS